MDKWMRRWVAYRRTLRESDVIVHVVDARDVPGTVNRELNKYKSKLLIAVNKCDLVPDSALAEAAERLWRFKHVFVSVKSGLGMHQFYLIVKKMAKGERAKVAVVGYPNVGKSSLMNRLGRRKAARVSPIPGETKGVQWVSVGDFLLVDTPGVVPQSEESGKVLALKGAVRADNIPSPEPIAEEIIARFLRIKPSAVADAYDIKVSSSDSADKIMKKIAKRRGRLLKGGELDLFEIAKIVIRDYQRGKISLR